VSSVPTGKYELLKGFYQDPDHLHPAIQEGISHTPLGAYEFIRFNTRRNTTTDERRFRQFPGNGFPTSATSSGALQLQAILTAVISAAEDNTGVNTTTRKYGLLTHCLPGRVTLSPRQGEEISADSFTYRLQGPIRNGRGTFTPAKEISLAPSAA